MGEIFATLIRRCRGESCDAPEPYRDIQDECERQG
jgi:hypothetical protein